MSRAVQYSRHGGPEVLELVEVPEPHAGPGHVRVAVRSAGLNAFDYKVRSDPDYLPNHGLPSGQGNEFAGIVDEVGDDDTGVSVGDEVLGWTGFAAQADYVVVPSTHVAAKPATLDWPSAGGIGLVGNTARRATDAVAPGPDDTVLIGGVAGGVGLFSAQFAIRAGAIVIGTASEANHEFLRTLGVIPVTYGTGLVERVRLVAPQGITAVIDTAGQETVEAALALGVARERINTIVSFPGVKQYGVQTVGGGGKTATELTELAEQVASGELVMPIAASYPLTEVREAYRRLESRHLLGKVVLLLP
ncbi:MAG: NADP-dependent oxidoreductase [Microbacteriaceae bacterium]|jgi:NADPH:quinone reductase-like Zn-dependent oxidoreductase|nr:NADP-dependent oxidoreductase [Microbacteriaceae bacterium]